MKRNLILVIILALVLVDIVLSAIMMVSTMSANAKTKALVDDIAAVLNLEMNPYQDSTDSNGAPSIVDTETYNIADEMVIALAPSGDGADHYAMVSVSLSIDNKHDDYATMQPLISTNESKIKSIVIDVVSAYTKDDVTANTKGIEAEITTKIQELFGSNFIYEVYFRDFKCQ
ncbi:MAG: flagellar basal body-associated FliL family protein [Lachnospiraceae bacterium]|nr:flagellar basal body-associated FliL family protein [Lachnospiraceae bacterium]